MEVRPKKPTITLTEAEQWARECFDIEATASALPGEVDRNTLLTARDGRRWVLKLSPAGTSLTEIECQLAVLQHLADSKLRDLVPRLVPARGGALTNTVRTAAGAECLLRLVTYLPGKPLATIKHPTPKLHREIGNVLGHLNAALTSFDHPGAHRHHVWDVVNVLELQPLLTSVAPELRPLVATGLDAFATKVAPLLPELPAGVVHNDANDYNLMVTEDDGIQSLCGLIDFGDMVHTITVAEPAIACAYVMLETEDPHAAAADLIAGYESAHPLTVAERELLPDLIVARLCNSLLMSAQARTMAPDDEYLRISERPVAELLKRLSR